MCRQRKSTVDDEDSFHRPLDAPREPLLAPCERAAVALRMTHLRETDPLTGGCAKQPRKNKVYTLFSKV
jgi:hypothetical protein